jgi:arginyl-tRNA synthetase
MIKQDLEQSIKQAFKSSFDFVPDELDISNPDPQFGDFAIACHLFAKDLKMSPQDIASKLSDTIDDGLITKSEAVAGYLNIFVDTNTLSKEVLSMINKKDSWLDKLKGKSKKEKIVLEYSSPNTNKPLHLGHIRNNILGMSLSNILNTQGSNVEKVQLINDRGIHIMKSLVAYQKLGENKTPETEKEKSDHFVGKYYVGFDEDTMMEDAQEALRKWEANDTEIKSLWKKMNDWVYKGYDVTYKSLGSEFDKNYYESEIYETGKAIIEEGVKKNIFTKEEDGSVSVSLEDIGLDKKTLQRSDGTSIYVTQDLALAVERQKQYKADSMIYVVGHEQEYHFKVLFEILKRLGYEWAENLYHLSYGLVYLPEGKMKSREGKVIDADDIIAEVKNLATDEIKKRDSELSDAELSKRAEIIGMGALKFMLLKVTPTQSIHYDPKQAISFEGSTGPYVQYVHARISSILEKESAPKKVKFELLKTPEEKSVVLKLMQYQNMIQDSAQNYNPSLVCNYLLELSQLFNTFYHKHKVLKAETEDLKKARLMLISSVQIVLKNGLELLGIEAPEKM